jgi:hypothetical protein
MSLISTTPPTYDIHSGSFVSQSALDAA